MPAPRSVASAAWQPCRGRPIRPAAMTMCLQIRKAHLVLTEPVHEIRVSRDRALGVLDVGQGPITAGGTLRNGYFFPLGPDRALEVLRRAGLEPVSGSSGGERGTHRTIRRISAVRATGWRSWQSGQSSVSCGTSSCGAGAVRAHFVDARSRKNFLSRRISSPAGHVRRTSAWIHETCPCSLVCLAATRSLSSAMLSSVIRESSNMAAAVPSRLRTGYGTSSAGDARPMATSRGEYFAWHRQHHSAKRGHRMNRGQ